jgi:Raf kinase inhibitor-like YbhB/YbcL family protein
VIAMQGKMTLLSPAFDEGGPIPAVCGFRKGNVSPPLHWSLPPAGTRSFALLVEDPDARGWVHWIAWNIPFSASGLAQGIPPTPQLPDGTRQGLNDFGKIGYGGPAPPSGIHRYTFRLMALDTVLDLPPGSERYDLLKAAEGHVLEETRLTGTFSAKS